jgi:hypothetical protein
VDHDQEADIQIAGGGPFRALLRRIDGLDLLPGQWHRAAIALAAIAWAPFVFLAIVELGRRGSLDSLDLDPSTHARLLLAIPFMLAAEALLDDRCRLVLTRFRAEGFTDRPDAFERVVQNTARTRDSWIPELLLLGGSIFVGQAVLWGLLPVSGLVGREGLTSSAVTPARLWYSLFCLPIFLFLLARMLWRWILWGILLARVSRLPPRPIPSHPDLTGGLEFLVEPTQGFALFAAGWSCVLSAGWCGQVLFGGRHAKDFAQEFLLFLGLTLVLAAAPLLPFAPVLARTRRRGLWAYGRLAHTYTESFQEKWVETPADASVLGTSDIQSLADLRSSFEIVSSMRSIISPKRLALMIVIPVSLPMLPLVLIEVPLALLVSRVGGALLGMSR